jgi:peptidoglycan-associated lipoprotein
MKVNIIKTVVFLAIFAIVLTGCPKKCKPPLIIPPDKEVKVETPIETTPPIVPVEKPKPKLALKTVYFDYDQFDLTGEAKAILTDNSKQLVEYNTVQVRVEGNCDERGTNAYNLSLGQKRAEAAKSFLVQYGVNAGRIETVSYGEEKPVCRDQAESCWWKNRRVEFVVTSQY